MIQHFVKALLYYLTLLIVVTESLTRNNLRYTVEGTQNCHGRTKRQLALHHQMAQSVQEAGPGYKTTRPSFCSPVPPAQLGFLKVPYSATSWGSVLRHMSLWGTCLERAFLTFGIIATFLT